MLCCEWQFALLAMTVLKPEEENGKTMTYDLLALFLTLARARAHTQMTHMCHHSHTYILLTSLTHRPTGTYMLQREEVLCKMPYGEPKYLSMLGM